MAKIIFKIKKNGEVSVDVDGIEGGVCKDLTKPFTDALGTVTEVVEKPEMYDSIDSIYTEVHEE